MARNIYGASGAAQVVSLAGTPTLAAATVKSARTGGVTITDIQNMAGANLGGVVTPDSRGQIIFQGPDNSSLTYWLDFGDGGPRWGVSPVDMPSMTLNAIVARELAQNLAPGSTTLKSAIPYVDNTAFENMAAALDPMVIPRFASASARDTAFPSPADGDRCYRTDIHAHQCYRNLGASRWVTDNALIAESVLAADTAIITFNNIPQDWRHLVLKFHARATGSLAANVNSQPVGIRFNNDTATNYGTIGYIRNMKLTAGTYTYDVNNAGGVGNTGTTSITSALFTNVLSAGATSAHAGYCAGSFFSTLYGGGEIDIDNYTTGSSRKSMEGRSGYGDSAGLVSGTGYSAYSMLQPGWQSSAAITRIDLLPISATAFASGSRFSLYGMS
jgi:hypothetical protein